MRRRLGGRRTPGPPAAARPPSPRMSATVPPAAGPNWRRPSGNRPRPRRPAGAARRPDRRNRRPRPGAPPRAPALVIWDDPAVRHLHERHLKGSGFEAVGAGAAAVPPGGGAAGHRAGGRQRLGAAGRTQAGGRRAAHPGAGPHRGRRPGAGLHPRSRRLLPQAGRAGVAVGAARRPRRPRPGRRGGVRSRHDGAARDGPAAPRAADAFAEERRRKDEFLAMLAHELRNPLSPIRNAAALLAEGRESGGHAAPAARRKTCAASRSV